jgi:hypothetical protein
MIMATNPEFPQPDTIAPQSPSEVPPGGTPSEAPYGEPPGFAPPPIAAYRKHRRWIERAQENLGSAA